MTFQNTICVAVRSKQKLENFQRPEEPHCERHKSACLGAFFRRLSQVPCLVCWGTPFLSARQKGNMSTFVNCPCQFCDKHIEFDSESFQAGQSVPCPHCGLDTILYEPNKVKPEPIGEKTIKTRKSVPGYIIGIGLSVLAFCLLGGLLYSTGNLSGFIIGFLQLAAGFAILGFVIFVYSLPYYCACKYERNNRNAIGLLNFLLGWTVLGWVVALVWSAMEDKE
jgi:hypothetical protein